jgi:hypothetical protein
MSYSNEDKLINNQRQDFYFGNEYSLVCTFKPKGGYATLQILNE